MVINSNESLALKKESNYLEAGTQSLQLLFRDLHLPSCHICGLFGIEWVSYTSRNEDVKLYSCFSLLLFSLLFVLGQNNQIREHKCDTPTSIDQDDKLPEPFFILLQILNFLTFFSNIIEKLS